MKLTNAEILEFVRDNLLIDKDENNCYILKDVYCRVDGNVHGDVNGYVFGSVKGSVAGDIYCNVHGSVKGDIWDNLGPPRKKDK